MAHVDYLSPAQAYAAAQGHLAYYRALATQGHVCIIGTREHLDCHIMAWRAWEAGPAEVVGRAAPRSRAEYGERGPRSCNRKTFQPVDAGVRVIGPAHYGPGRYAGGTGTELGFTAPGLALLVEMERLGVLLYVTHRSDQAFWQALDRYGRAQPRWPVTTTAARSSPTNGSSTTINSGPSVPAME